MNYSSDRTLFRSLPALFFFLLLFQGNVPGARAQDLHGDRIVRGSFVEMRSYNRELGRYWGYGGFGGTLDGQGPVVGSVSVTGGWYSEKEGTHQVYDPEPGRDVIVDNTFDGWGFDLKYQYMAFLNGRVDESGVFLRWATSFHFARFYKEYHSNGYSMEDLAVDDGHVSKMDLYSESGLGYQFDLGFTNLNMEFHGGFPTITGVARKAWVALGEDSAIGSLTDIDEEDLFFAMPFYYGFKASVMI